MIKIHNKNAFVILKTKYKTGSLLSSALGTISSSEKREIVIDTLFCTNIFLYSFMHDKSKYIKNHKNKKQKKQKLTINSNIICFVPWPQIQFSVRRANKFYFSQKSN